LQKDPCIQIYVWLFSLNEDINNFLLLELNKQKNFEIRECFGLIKKFKVQKSKPNFPICVGGVRRREQSCKELDSRSSERFTLFSDYNGERSLGTPPAAFLGFEF